MHAHHKPAESATARVLLAEDNPQLRRLLAAELRKAGFGVTEAGTGFELIERVGDLTLRNEAFDLIVTDVRMPGVTGLVVVDGLRHGGKASSATPVILITAFGDRQVHAEAKRLSAVLFDKPFDLAEFRACAAKMATAAPRGGSGDDHIERTGHASAHS